MAPGCISNEQRDGEAHCTEEADQATGLQVGATNYDLVDGQNQFAGEYDVELLNYWRRWQQVR